MNASAPKIHIAITSDGKYCVVVGGVRIEPLFSTASAAIREKERLERQFADEARA
jgi:hypothetical protein